MKYILIQLIILISVKTSYAQSGEKSPDIFPIKFEIGLQTSESALQPGVPWYPDLVPMLAIKFELPKDHLGIRFRKEFWYRLNRFRLEQFNVVNNLSHIFESPNIFWERSSLDIYKRIRLKNEKFIGFGAGLSWVSPGWLQKNEREYPIFISYEIDWFELELRISLKDRGNLGRSTELGIINLTAYYSFPR
ncbi:MAG: hypothetical protein AAFR87_29075 [Bacteroidota bacterium]